MKKWTDEPGEFLEPKHEGDQGIWIGRHLRFDGRGWGSTKVSVNLYREDGIPYKEHPTSHRLHVHVSKSLSAEQARQLARVLNDAADAADALQEALEAAECS